MNETSYGKSSNFTDLAVDLVAAYVANNPVPVAELPALITRIYGAIASLGSGAVPVETATSTVDRPGPAQVRKSVHQDGIVSFIDGKTYKTLKRHLSAHGLSPQGYRERYGLPSDYPMVAPSYAEQRSALAKAIGLGQPGAMAKRKGRAA